MHIYLYYNLSSNLYVTNLEIYDDTIKTNMGFLKINH